MKYTSKKEYEAVVFDGSYESLITVLKTFPDATFRVEMDDGVINLEIMTGVARNEYSFVTHGNYIIFEDDRYNVYYPEDFIRCYGTAPSELAEQEIDAADIPREPIEWIPYNEPRVNVGSDGTRWYDQPLLGEDRPHLGKDEIFD